MMTIKQYLDKIHTLSISENIGKPDYADLENTVIEILQDKNKSYFDISDLEFITDGKEGKQEIILNPEIIKQVADCLSLQFLKEKTAEGNVCFINSDELRPEFRQGFTTIDLLDYCYAILQLGINEISEIASETIPITSESSIFWKLVKHGSDWRKK